MTEDFLLSQAPYWSQLRSELISCGFCKSLYTEPKEVMKILENGLHLFSTLFEDWCIQHITSSKDLGKILWIYSLYERNNNSGIFQLSEEDINALYTCRYILSIAPKLSLSVHAEPIIKDNTVCLPELFLLTNTIGQLNQFRCVAGLSKEASVCVKITEEFVYFDYLDDNLDDLLHMSKIKGNAIIAPSYVDYDIGIDFDSVLRETFGLAASSLLDAFLFENVDYSPTNDNVTPKDFTKYRDLYGNTTFAKELILNKECVNFYNVITKPHSTNYRTRFRPLIEINVDGKLLLASTKWLLFEAYSELALNRLPFGELPKSWLKFDKIKKFANDIHDKVGKSFELHVKSHISNQFKSQYNIKSICNQSVEDFPVYVNGKDTGRTVGQIDFIILNEDLHVIYIADAKNLKSKYFTASFYNDKSKFDTYYTKLLDKASWAKEHRSLISRLFDVDVSDFEVQECFITDAYVFYSLFVDYPIIPVKALNAYLSTNDKLCFLK